MELLLQSRRDHRDFRRDLQSVKQTEFVDLRPYDLGVETQGSIGSCVGNAIASAYEIMQNQQYPGTAINLSRLFLYFNARILEDSDQYDNGASIRNALRAGKFYGLSSEELWPYKASSFNDKPTPLAYCNAAYRTILDFKRLSDATQVKLSLDQFRPVVIAIDMYENFNNITPENPYLSAPTETDEFKGTHAMLIVGYGPRSGYFLTKNSYGLGWGQNGYCYIPEDFITRGIIFEMWAFEISPPSVIQP